MTLRLLLSLILLAGCQASVSLPDDGQPGTEPTAFLPARVIGSAQSPDPVLLRVREMERAGSVREVVVLESFPVQIHLQGTAQALAELERIERVPGSEPAMSR